MADDRGTDVPVTEEDLPALRPEGLSTTVFERRRPARDDFDVRDERALPPREGKVRTPETAPDTEPDRLRDETDLPVEVKVRPFETAPETLPDAGLLKVPLDRAPRSARVARERTAETDLNAGEARFVRPAEGRMLGWSALKLMRPSAPSSEDRRACLEIAGDCRRSRRTTVMAREFQG